ncbi:amidase signature enzyme [Lentithecium fluviatile CBS 122367]|uniref:Amidase signature enzyme n=1 Tax=Lentithecium fluviatile CBS 122367 TaxID=1168545 RepID=A0A6G1IDF3_9PLEO|nr:amidase signature enzyme [Lentithecium fluviatile CBS 122367]
MSLEPGETVSKTWLRESIANFTNSDDVFHPHFLEGIILQGAEQSQVKIDIVASEILQEWGIKWTHFRSASSAASSSSPLPLGPYFVQNGELFRVWRLYSDEKLAFLQSVWPATGSTNTYTQVPFSGAGYRTLAIAVPSRLQASWPSPLPLEGVRIGVKDLYHLKGIRTSLCNRAFNDLYPPQPATASTINQLISKGVHVVGKNHLSSFALQEHPTQSVDYESPFNPRADGYQIPGGSSSGSASAVASYEWLDFALATDATGSVRIPALANGCFGLRPSTGAISTDGVVSVYPGFDTPGLLGRDLGRFHGFMSHWYGEAMVKISISSPKIVIPTDFLPESNSAQLRLFDGFVQDLEHSLDTVAQRRSIAEEWSKSAPVDERDLNVYLQNATLHSYYYAAYHAFHAFRESYKESFGRTPFVTEVNQWLWDLGADVSQEQNDEMNKRILKFKEWFLREYIKADEEDFIIILPISDVKPNYRDVYPGKPNAAGTGLRTTYLSPYLGAPEIAIPIGHLQYASRISGNTESLPVAVSLLGPPGSDLALVRLAVDSLRASNRPTLVSVGTARMWEHDTLPSTQA